MNKLILLSFLVLSFSAFCQQTKVTGFIRDANSGLIMPLVKVQFKDSKIGALSDTLGFFSIETYYATDSLVFSFPGYITQKVKIKKDESQELNVLLAVKINEFDEVKVLPPDEFPSTTLHKKVIAHKDINNKEKLVSYEYELYNKIQLDLTNFGDKAIDQSLMKRLDLVMNYLDSTDNGKNYLPVILSESISNFYFRNNPKKRKEVVTASRISGVENIQLNQFLGDMYLDINIYDNTINLFNKSFVSPVSNFARNYYRFYLEDSTYIDNQWCYKLTFVPKRSGDATFQGEMWIHDTTYAVKQISARISETANINYVQNLYFEHHFDQVAKEVWMLTKEKMMVDFKVTEKSNLHGLFGQKLSTRKNFEINTERPNDFYQTDNTVELADSAKTRSKEYWEKHRHEELNIQEQGIDEMIDSLNHVPFFKTLKNLTYFVSTGYYRIGKIEVGSAYSLISVNPVEDLRLALSLRTSNNFSKRLELGGRIAYGFGDSTFKYRGSFRYNISPKKRGMLTGYYLYDIEQIGQSPTAAAIGSTFGTLFRTGPLDKLTMVQKAGINLEKDIRKDLILYGGFEWKQYSPIGVTQYIKFNGAANSYDTLNQITSSEFIARIRWAKNEEFIASVFDRKSVGSKYPILSIQGIFGIKGLLGGNYNYQKIEFTMEHTRQIGVLGRMRYGVNAGYVFGKTAYPFLKVHEGNQSYWLLTSAFNKLNYFEFISDQYIGGFVENHWEGLLFDRLPLIKKLKWRLVTSGRITYGSISSRNTTEMILPTFTKQFGNTPYAEVAVGIENIFKVGRVDLVWRITHLDPGMSPVGIRARWAINF